MKSIFALLVLVAPFSSRAATQVADFSGHWIANSGQVSSTVGMSAKCTKIEIVIEQTEQQLLTKSYKADCGVYSSSWGPVTEEFKGDGKVYEDGDEVGTISNDTMITVSQDGGVAYAYNLKLIAGPDGKPVLETYYGVKNGVGAIVIEGNLQKVADH